MLGLSLLLFFTLNFVSYRHAYKFTHFSTDPVERTKDPKELSIVEKLETLFMGIDNPKPVNKRKPTQAYHDIVIDDSLACWIIKAPDAKGTVILFHGYAGEKSSLLDRSDALLSFGYTVMLVDFKGSGESKGNSTSIGFFEADQVKRCYDYLVRTGEQDIFLFGTSMGAAAILKCVNDYDVTPKGIILECPFGSLYKTTCARFRNMGVPSFPMAGLLLFWGGVQNDFWALGHNPSAYAQGVSSPTILIFGEQDDRVSREETDAIFANLNGPKTLAVYPESGHNDLFTPQWISDVSRFLKEQEVK